MNLNNEFYIKRKKINCIIPIWPLQHEKMSLQAKGLLALLLSFPDGWRIRMNDITSRSSNGRDATRKAIRELIACGYVQRERIRDPNTKQYVGCSYMVFDESQTPRTAFQSTET